VTIHIELLGFELHIELGRHSDDEDLGHELLARDAALWSGTEEGGLHG
jgi:hypothetical protein